MPENRILAIGIDGFDPLLIKKWIDDLPIIKKLIGRGKAIPMESVYPIDSASAWASIYLSVNPAKHGIIHHLDYFQLEKMRSNGAVEQGSILNGKTFWDILSATGKKVSIINPFSAYPAWQVNGVMVSGPFFKGGSVSCYPPQIGEKTRIPSIGGMTSFPETDELDAFYEDSLKETEELTDFGCKIFSENPYDLYFICYLAADRIQHFLWRFCDSDDPTHPHDNIHIQKVHDFYVLMDKQIGRLIEAVPEKAKIIIFSDHGHGMRCLEYFNVNEFLRQQGFLKTKSGKMSYSFLIERMKNKTLRFLNNVNLHDWIYKISAKLPFLRKFKKGDHLILRESDNLAEGDQFAGSNPFGGIRISRKAIEKNGMQYELFRDTLIDLLQDIRNKDSEPIMRWVKKREELYKGGYISKYPDIVYYLSERYGSAWSLYDDIICRSYTHKKISGGHKLESALIISGDDLDFIKSSANIIDIAPTILKITGTKIPDYFDGENLIGKA